MGKPTYAETEKEVQMFISLLRRFRLLFSSWFVAGHFDPIGSPLQFFSMDDAMNVKWCLSANTKAQLTAALKSDCMILSGDTTLNQSQHVIMSHYPDVDTFDVITLDAWLDDVIADSNRGVKLSFQSAEVVEPALKLLKSRRSEISFPVWVNAPVVKGPGSDQEPFVADK